jgi:TonB family protein
MHPRLWIPVVLGLSAAAPAAAQDVECSEPSGPRNAPRPAQAERYGVLTELREAIGLEVEEAARAAGISEPAGLVVIELRNRRTGEARVSLFGSNVPEAVAAQAVERRAQTLVRMPRDQALLHVRLDPLPMGPLGRACMPSLLDPQLFTTRLWEITHRLPPVSQESAARLSARVRMLVTRDGEVVYATLVRRSSRGDVDREVLELVRELRFAPARVNDVPVDVWVEQPVEVRLRVQASGGQLMP